MFHVCAEPLLFSQAGIHGLSVSLNTPVLNIDELPVGPARAAIVLFEDGYGALSLGIGIRSIETRRVAVFSYQETIGAGRSRARALDAATKFAEGMGFLFDEDLIASDPAEGRARAMRLWTELTDVPASAEPAPPEPAATSVPRLSPAVPLEQPPDELELDDLADFDLGVAPGDLSASEDAEADAGRDELWLEDMSQPLAAPDAAAAERPAAAETPPSSEPVAAEATPERPPAAPRVRPASPRPAAGDEAPVPLSRFRQPPASGDSVREMLAASRADDDAEGSAPGGAALGRVTLVRKRVGGQSAPDKPSLLLRLLSHF